METARGRGNASLSSIKFADGPVGQSQAGEEGFLLSSISRCPPSRWPEPTAREGVLASNIKRDPHQSALGAILDVRLSACSSFLIAACRIAVASVCCRGG